MNDYSIKVEGLSKKYKIYHSQKARLAELLFLGKKTFHRDFWALSDISFSIKKGETFGIVGANGAGKSTLLKILAGITRQTSGVINVQGNVSALLELGAGFHPDFTGRENLYMNGALIGFSKEGLDRIYNEVVDFAELWDFMDMPIKTYSSGMYVRLAFAIATSVDPDVLIVDEALSVGDEYFQKKCIDRMKKFMETGKTVIFVSHDFHRIRRICQRSIWLDKGRIMAVGDSDSVVSQYIDFLNEMQGKREKAEDNPLASGSIEVDRTIKEIQIKGVELLDDEGKPCSVFKTGDTLVIKVEYLAIKPLRRITFGVAIYRNDNLFVTASNTYLDNIHREEVIDGPGSYSVIYKNLPLLEGTYHVTVGIFDEKAMYTYDYHDRRYRFTLERKAQAEGMIVIPHDWSFVDQSRHEDKAVATVATTKFLNVEFSSRCVLRCKWCSLDHGKDPVFLEKEVLSGLLEEVIESGHFALERIDLHNAGETLLHPDIGGMLAVIANRKRSASKFPEVALLTNAVLLDEEMSRTLLDSGALDLVRFSVDGGSPEAFEEIRKGAKWPVVSANIRRFIELNNRRHERVRTGIITIVPPEKAKNTDWMKEEFKELLLMADGYELRHPHNWDGSVDLGLEDLPQCEGGDRVCGFLVYNLVVLPDAHVSVCCADLNARGVIGNLKENSLFEIYCSEARQKMLKLYREGRKDEIELCRSCMGY